MSAAPAPTGELTVRVDSGFWSNDTIATLNRLDVRYTMAVRCGTKGIADAIAAIDETAWVDIDYTPDGASPSRRMRLHHRHRHATQSTRR